MKTQFRTQMAHMPNTDHISLIVKKPNEEHVVLIKQGVAAWNAWRVKNPKTRPDLFGAKLGRADLRGADLHGADLSRADLHGADLQRADLMGADLIGTYLQKADLRGAHLIEANLQGADLQSANLQGACLIGAYLDSSCLIGANLSKAILHQATFVNTDLTGADLTGCKIYGVSAWKLKLEGAKQKNLVITDLGEPEITVDNIEVAQFIYLLLHNQKIRDVIDTITSKAVLILGRFSDKRKKVLDALQDELRKRGYLPILFDFKPSASLDVTETITVLAGLARFVIADITDATEVRVELHKIVKDFTSLAVQPILLKGQPEFVSFSHLKKFPWLLPSFEYDSQKHLLANLGTSVISRAEGKVLELRGQAAQQVP
jgi:hypothetical protein